MNQIKLLFIFIFICFQGFSQITSVEYLYTINSLKPTTNSYQLVFNNFESYYYKLENQDTINRANDEVNTLKSEKIFFNKSFLKFYHVLFAQDTLFHQNSVLETPYYVYENIPKLDWQIKDEFKTIEKYKCIKAVTKFRGRSYEVWFTPDIPTQAGPWKLIGLPGLILSFKDDTNTILAEAKEIKFEPDKNIKNSLSFLKPKGKKIALQEFVPIKDNELDEYIKKFRAKMGIRNSDSFFQKPDKRQGLEVIYEWEEKQTK